MAMNNTNKVGEAYIEVKADMKTLAKDFRKMKTTTEKQVSRMTNNIKKRFSGLNSFLSSQMVGIGGAFLGFQGVLKGFRKFTEFDQGLRNINTILNVSTKELNKLGKGLQDVQREVGVGGKDITDALYQAASAGVAAGDSIEFVRVAAKAANAGLSDTKTSVDGLTTVINAWGMKSKDATKVADVMFKTVKLGKTTFGEIAGSISLVASLAAASGISFEEVSASLATLTKQGVPTSVAMTQIRSVIIALNKNLGDGWSQTMSFQDGIEALRKKARGSQNVLKEMIGRVEGVNAVLGLTGQNAKTAAQDITEMNTAAGAMGKAFAEQGEAVSTKIERMNASIETAVTTLMYSLAPTISWIADNFSGGMQKIMGSNDDLIASINKTNAQGWSRIFEGYSAEELKAEIGIVKKEIENAPATFGGFLHNVVGITTEDTKKEIQRISILKSQLEGLKIALKALESGTSVSSLIGDDDGDGASGKTPPSIAQPPKLPVIDVEANIEDIEIPEHLQPEYVLEQGAVKLGDAPKQIGDTYKEAQDQIDETIARNNVFLNSFQSAAMTVTNIWTRNLQIFKQTDNILGDMVNKFIQIVSQQTLLAGIGSFADGGSGLLGFIGDLFNSGGHGKVSSNGITRAASGASGIVPAGYGRDTFPMLMRSGEHFEVKTPGDILQSKAMLKHINEGITRLNMNMANNNGDIIIQNTMDADSLNKRVLVPNKNKLDNQNYRFNKI